MGIGLLIFDAIVIMQNYFSLEEFLGIIGITSIAAAIGIATVIGKFVKTLLLTKKADFSKFIDNGSLQINKCYEIKREEIVNSIVAIIDDLANSIGTESLKCMFLTGESGSGKSYLLKEFVKMKLENKGQKYSASVHLYHSRNEYNEFCEKEAEPASVPSIFILDQFEYFYDDVYVLAKINKLPIEDTVIIFVFQENYMAKIFEKLEDELKQMMSFIDVKRHIRFIKTTTSDIEDLFDVVAKLFEIIFGKKHIYNKDSIMNSKEKYYPLFDRLVHTTNTKERKTILKDIEAISGDQRIRVVNFLLYEIEKGKKPLVAFYAVAYIMGIRYFNNSTLLSKISFDRSDELVEVYIDKWANEHHNAENANALLYFLTRMNECNKNDVRRLLYMEDDVSPTDACDLDGLFFVENKEGPAILKRDSVNDKLDLYTIRHEYFKLKIYDYLTSIRSKISLKDFSELKGNIDSHISIFSNSYIDRKGLAVGDRQKLHETESARIQDAENQFDDRLNEYIMNKKRVSVYCFILVLLASAIQGFNFIRFLNNDIVTDIMLIDRIQRICLSIVLTVAIFYAYNLIKNIFCLFNQWVYISASIVGVLSILMTVAYPNHWGITIGIKVFCIGFIHMILIAKYKISSFKDVAWGAIILGPIISVLGVYYLFGLNQYISLGMRFYIVESDVIVLNILFIAYAAYCIIIHINQRFALNRAIYINNLIYGTENGYKNVSD